MGDSQRSKYSVQQWKTVFSTLFTSTFLVLVLVFVALILKTSAIGQERDLAQNTNIAIALGDNLTDLDQLLVRKRISQLNWVDKLQNSREGYLLLIPNRNQQITDIDAARYTDELLTIKGVSKIIYPRSLNAHATDFISGLNKLSNILLIAAGIIALLFTYLIIRVLLYSKKATIYTMKLVGAKQTYVYRTFLKPIFWCSLAAGLFTAVIVSLGIYLFTYLGANIIGSIDIKIIYILIISLPVVGILINGGNTLFILSQLYKMNRKQINSI